MEGQQSASEQPANKKPKREAPVLTDFDLLPDSAWVSTACVAAVLGVSEVTVWRWDKAGKLPPARKLGANTSRRNVGELRAAICKLAA